MLNESRPPKAGAVTDDQVLVRLCEDGDKPPLYFIPAGYGDIRLFRNVVARLDGDRPVYGLQPPRVGQIEGLRKKPVEWLISTYVAEIRKLQPTGPYLLAGYSSGGLLTASTAQQLIREGDAVDLLILLDPPLQNPWWINVSYLGANRLCNLTQLTDTIRWTLIRRWDSLLLRCLSDEGLCTHVAILREHEVESYPGRIVYFRPRRSWIRLVGRTLIGRSWRKIARGGLEVHRVPGAHNEMLRGKQGRIFSAVLRGCLRKLPDTERTRRPSPRIQDSTSSTVTRHSKTLYSASIKQGRIDEEFDWDTMEQLNQEGLAPDPLDMASSEALFDVELHERAAAFQRLLEADD